MAFGQMFKKRNGGPGENNEENAFSFGETNIEIPEIDGVMQQIDRNLQKTMPVKSEPEERQGGCGCWG